MAIKAICIDDTNTHHLLIGLNREKVRLPRLLFHDLRRSAIQNVVRAGIPEATAMKMPTTRLGQSSTATTSSTGKDIEDAGKKLAEFLKGQA